MADKSENPNPFIDDEEDTPVTHDAGVPTDTGLDDQWHLGTTGSNINVRDAWLDYTGEGVVVGVADDGFDYLHPDLSPNYRTDLDWSFDGSNDAAPNTADDNHGTAVMGLIGADDNGAGVVGVAFDSTLVGYQVSFGGAGFDADFDDIITDALGTLDVFNNSWGYSGAFVDNFDDGTWDFAVDGLISLVDVGRGGLGITTLFAGGNERDLGDDSNHHSFSNSPYVIAVGATDTDGTYASFSSPGANLLVSAPGVGVDTTDRLGADGYNATDFEAFAGTSAATPIVSGVVALMYDANPDLGYRDVQEILAYSAQHNDAIASSWSYNGAGNWNSGGLHFSNDYGFGLVDATAAVRLAETWNLSQTYDNIVTVSGTETPGTAIPDEGSISDTMTIAGSIEIEKVLIHTDIDHTWGGDLTITLTSPDGTESVLADRPDGGWYVGDIDFTFSSNAFWGEDSAGTWTLDIDDNAAQDTGTLVSWSLEFIGNNHPTDDLYVFTDAFGDFSGAELGARNTLTDSDGGTDTINLAAVTSNVTVDLSSDSITNINGNDLAFGGVTVIENVILGDGADDYTGSANNDIVNLGRGNDVANAGAGNDTLIGGAGDDTLNGGAGTDTVDYSAAVGAVTVDLTTGTTANDGDGGSDSLTGFENVTGSANADTISGDTNANTLSGGSGDDTLSGRGGADTLVGGAGTDTVDYSAAAGAVTVDLEAGTAVNDGDGGSDTLTGFENIVGSANGDDLTGDASDNVFFGMGGSDSISGGAGQDTLDYSLAGGGVDVRLYQNETREDGDGHFDTMSDVEHVTGSMFDDVIYGNGFQNILDGGFGNDVVFGFEGDDFIYGQDGNDNLKGSAGNDSIYGHSGADKLNGHDGNDYLNGGRSNDILHGKEGADEIYGGKGHDKVWGAHDNDFIDGQSGDDYLRGNKHDDVIYGGIGDDTIFGDGGDDFLRGDGGDDLIFGRAGADTFIWLVDEIDFGTEFDRVSDFNPAEGDLIRIDNVLNGFNPLTDSVTDFVQLQDHNSHTNMFLDADGDGDNFILFARLFGINNLTDEQALYDAGSLLIS